MKHVLLAAVLALAAASSGAQSLSARSLTVTGIRDAAFIEQVGGGASAHIGPLAVSSRGYTTRKLATPAGGSPGALPLVPVSNPVAEDVALAAGQAWAAAHMPGYVTRVAGWLRSNGVGMAYYSFSQPITISSTIGGLRPKRITFIASIDSGGGAVYGNPKVVDDNPLYLDVKYTPRRGADGIPQTAAWQYPDPGTLQWRVISERGDPVGGSLGEWHLVAGVNGHFDPSSGSANTNPLEKVPCLVDRRNSGCAAGLPDVRTLMNQTGASFGRVTYMRPVEPAYQDAGDGYLIPQGTVVLTRRRATCTQMWEEGNYELTLDLRADQFAVTPANPIYRMEALLEFSGLGTSPIQSYSVTATWDQAWPTDQDQPHNWRDVMLNPVPSSDFRYWTLEDARRVGLVVQSVPLQELENLSACPRNTARDPIVENPTP